MIEISNQFCSVAFYVFFCLLYYACVMRKALSSLCLSRFPLQTLLVPICRFLCTCLVCSRTLSSSPDPDDCRHNSTAEHNLFWKPSERKSYNLCSHSHNCILEQFSQARSALKICSFSRNFAVAAASCFRIIFITSRAALRDWVYFN